MMNKEERVIRLVECLENTFEIRTFQDHDPYQVLIRTILSQRTRDENTDQATNNLFSKYRNIYEVAEAPIDDVKELIRPAGFYNVKAARIQEVSQILIDQYGGEVPDTVETRSRTRETSEAGAARGSSSSRCHSWRAMRVRIISASKIGRASCRERV